LNINLESRIISSHFDTDTFSPVSYPIWS